MESSLAGSADPLLRDARLIARLSSIPLGDGAVPPMTKNLASGTIGASMLYVLALVMFVACCIIAIGFAGRGPREGHDSPPKDPR